MINQKKLRILGILLLLLLVQMGVTQENYRVKRGERPTINLQELSPDAYHKGIIRIKLNESFSDQLISSPPIVEKDGVVLFSIPAIDGLNKKYGVKSFSELFKSKALSSRHAARHKAWGFHLWFTLYFDESTDIKTLVSEYSKLDEISICEPEYKIVRTTSFKPVAKNEEDNSKPASGSWDWTPDDPDYPEQWHYHNTGQQAGMPDADIDLPEAWDLEKGNSNVIVAIEDGGIQTDHPDISGNMWSGIGYDFYNDDATIEADDHGTHVAGTVAAESHNGTGVSGIAGGSGSGDGVRLMSCQVFTPAGNGGGFAVAPVYAADNGACISQNSWSYDSPGTFSQSVLDAIDYFNVNGGGSAFLDGGITIYSAGNNNSSGNYYPACYSGTFSVAATNNIDIRSYYSNFGTWIDISAPGGETNSVSERGILSTVDNDAYDFYQGTSMAAPHVSGVAALVASLSYGSLTSDEVTEIMKYTADNHYAVNPTYEGELGAGRINAHKALVETPYIVAGLYNPPSFKAIPVSKYQINLSWTKNSNNHDVMILWSLDESFGMPANGTSYSPGETIPGGGTVLYSGSDLSVNHSGLTPETEYFYRAYSYNGANEYSSGRPGSASTHCNPISILPWDEGFENIGSALTFTTNTPYIDGLCTWSYEMVDGGRLRFEAGDGFYHSGTKAATLDRSPTGAENINYLITELDLSDYVVSTDIELAFYYMHHGEESDFNDRVWIRGSNTDDWIEIYDLYLYQGSAGNWNEVSGLDIDQALSDAIPSQTPSSTFQIRFGQEDNYPASSTTAQDGYTFDDISISGTLMFRWSGAISDDWNNPGNWINNGIPTMESLVVIPPTATNWPVKTGDLVLGTSCKNIYLDEPAELRVTGDIIIPEEHTFEIKNTANVIVEGSWENNGTFIPGTGSIIFEGETASSIESSALATANLETIFSGDNSSTYGSMFDIIALNDITITNIETNLPAGTSDASIYYKAGSYVGFENNASAWTLLGTVSVTSAGSGLPTAIPIPIDLSINASDQVAFYIHNDNKITYSIGTAAGEVFASNDDLQILEGCGKWTPAFSLGSFCPRVFNGIFHYTKTTTGSITYNNLLVSKSNAELVNNSNLTLTGDLTVNPGAWLTNSPDRVVDISGNLLLEADPTAMASFIDKGITTVSGTTSVEQHISFNPPYQYHGVSSPITDATINTYNGLYMYEYDEPSNSFIGLSSPTSLPMVPGEGYYITGSEQYTGASTVTFQTSTPSGKLNNEDIDLTGFTYSEATSEDPGWRLIGNPFPCAIQWDESWTTNDMSGWMMLISDGDYEGYHPTLGPWNDGTGTIPSTQGFWVRAQNSDAGLTIPTSQRIHSDQAFFKSQLDFTHPIVRLEVVGGNNEDETVVAFLPDGNTGYDGYYDLTKFSNQEGKPQLYSISEGTNYAFNVLPPEYLNQVVPIHFEIANAGLYTLYASEIENFTLDTRIYLEDLKDNVITDLQSSPEYEFSYDPADNPHRFNLHFKDSYFELGEVENQSIRIYSHTNQLVILSPPGRVGEVKVYDLMGRELLSQALDISGDTRFAIANGMGYYVVKVTTEGDVKSAKVLIQ